MELELKLLSISPLYFVAICTIYVYVRIFPRQREYIYKRARTLLCKELAHTLVRAAGLEIHRAGWQARNSGKSRCCSLGSEFCRLVRQVKTLGSFSVLSSVG